MPSSEKRRSAFCNKAKEMAGMTRCLVKGDASVRGKDFRDQGRARSVAVLTIKKKLPMKLAIPKPLKHNQGG